MMSKILPALQREQVPLAPGKARLVVDCLPGVQLSCVPMLQPNHCIVFEGDSNTSRRNPPCLDTWAYLRLNNWHITYADRVEEWLFCNCPELKTRVRNSAVGGSSIREVLGRYEKNVKPLKPDWLVLTVQANDANRGIPLDEFRGGLRQLCSDVRADKAGRVMWVDTGHDDDAGEKGQRTRPYRDAARAVMAEHNGIVVPAGEVLARKQRAHQEIWQHHTVRTGEDGHLNIIAAEIVSTLVLEALGVLKVQA